MTELVRRNVRVEGVVQGVGFRPFVYGLATRLGVAGRVGNDLHGVFVEVEGTPAQVEAFLAGLTGEAPPLAAVERITTSVAAPTGTGGFSIVASDSAGSGARSSPRTARPATTVSRSCSTPRTAGTATRS